MRCLSLFVLALSIPWLPASLEAQPATPVRFTEALDHEVRRSLRLTGTVEAVRTAVVASEVAGVVERLLAREGMALRRGTPLVRLRREPLELRLEAARGQLAEAEARLASAELRLERTRELEVSQVVSRQTVDDVRYEVEALQGRTEQLRAEVARLERDLEIATVRAPFSGVVGREHVQMGEWLGTGDPVMELIDLDELEVRLEVPERHFGGLEPGTGAEVRLEALPDLVIDGEIRAIVPRANPQSRTFPVLVRIPNPDRRLGAGMLAEVDLSLGRPGQATLVPKDAVVTRGDERAVFILDGDDAVRRVRVEIGAGSGGWIEVRGEIEAGQRVITRGNELLADGQKVAGEQQAYPPPTTGVAEGGP